MSSISPREARHAQNRINQQESTATLDILLPICLPLQAFTLPPGQSQAKDGPTAQRMSWKRRVTAKDSGTQTENVSVHCHCDASEQKAMVKPKHVHKAREHSPVKTQHGKGKCMKLQLLSRWILISARLG